VRNAPEVVSEVGVHDFRMARKQQLLHLYGGLLGDARVEVGERLVEQQDLRVYCERTAERHALALPAG